MCIIMVIYWKIVFLAMLLAHYLLNTVYFTLNKYALKILVSGTTDNSQL